VSFKHNDSIEKTLTQIRIVAKEPFVHQGQVFSPPEKGLVITENFWREFRCYLNCGACCQAFTLDYLPDEAEVFGEIYPYIELQERFFEINGEKHLIYTHWNNPGQAFSGTRWCDFLGRDEAKCNIHQLNPYSCNVELIKFVESKGKGYIRKAPFSRGWNMVKFDGNRGNLPCTFHDFSVEQFIKNDLVVLGRLRDWATHLGVDTYLPEIIREMKALSFLGKPGKIMVSSD
jgi:Fe-S-cluster containining protein